LGLRTSVLSIMSNLPARKGQESVPPDLMAMISMSGSYSSSGGSAGESATVALATGTLGGGMVPVAVK
jgi:hypothetical protein